jgi:glycosyltransferase involved in cell wall biosynthesis
VAFQPRHAIVHRLKYTSTCDGIIAVSNAVRSTLLGAGVPEEKIAVIPNGIEIPDKLASDEERASARLKWGFRNEHFVVGHLGAFTPEKGQDVAMTAAALLEKRLPQLRMILAGHNPPGAKARPNVVLPGFVANREEFFAALDLFIMPSLSEGWGLAAAEALARAIPVVASATGGLIEIVELGETGWLVPPGDSTALADAMAEAACDANRLRSMGEMARRRSERFSAVRMGELTDAFYRRILEKS